MSMSTLLEQAFIAASQLPELEQDFLARIILDEIESEREWARLFSESQDVLARLGQEAVATHSQSETERHGP
jgi:hypothetical protein